MRAIVPAAGEGSRLGALARDRPKPLQEVAGRPILAHVLERLAAFPVEALVVVVGREGQRIIETFGDRWGGLAVHYVTQPEPLGLAHAVLMARPLLPDDFLLMHGDVIFEPGVDLDPVVRAFSPEDVAASLLVERVHPSRLRRGACRVGPEGRLLDAREYPDAAAREWGRVAAGFYACGPAVLDACERIAPSEGGEYELSDALGWLVARGHRVVTRELAGKRVNVNSPEDLSRAQGLKGR